jgi:putative NADPH-quinone reductase
VKCLVVIAHPLRESLCGTLAAAAVETLRAAEHDVEVEDLYRNELGASLTVDEQASYYGGPYDSAAVQPQIDRLLRVEGLVLCFPTWWFGFPAILGICAPACAFEMLSLYQGERLDGAQVKAFAARVEKTLARWG